jgi:hypothetical protein
MIEDEIGKSKRKAEAEIRNPKSEIRRKSEIRNPKGMYGPAPGKVVVGAGSGWRLGIESGANNLCHRALRISDFGFRISDFGF